MTRKYAAGVVRSLMPVVSIVFTFFTHSNVARAQLDTAEGERLAEEGYDAFQVGDYLNALDQFRRAAAYFPLCPSSKLWAARSLEKLGRSGEALELYDSVTHEAALADEAPLCAQARQESADAHQRLTGTVGWLDLEVTGLTGPLRELTIEPNGEGVDSRAKYIRTLPAGSVQVAGDRQIYRWHLGFAPGALTLLLNTGSAPHQASATVRVGQTSVVSIDVSLEPSQSTGAENGRSETSTAARPTTWWMWAGFGVGAAGAAVGGISGVLSSLDVSTVSQQCDQNSYQCTQRGSAALRRAESRATVSNVAWGVGLVGVAIGVVLLVADSDQSTDNPERPPAADFAVKARPVRLTADARIPLGGSLMVTW